MDKTYKHTCPICGKEFALSADSIFVDHKGTCFNCNVKTNSSLLKKKCKYFTHIFPNVIGDAVEQGSMFDALKKCNIDEFAKLETLDYEYLEYIYNAVIYLRSEGVIENVNISFNQFFEIYDAAGYSLFLVVSPYNALATFITTGSNPNDYKLIEQKPGKEVAISFDDKHDRSISEYMQYYMKLVPSNVSIADFLNSNYGEHIWENDFAKRYKTYEILMGEYTKHEKMRVLDNYKSLIKDKKSISEISYFDEDFDEMVEKHYKETPEFHKMGFYEPKENNQTLCNKQMTPEEMFIYDSILPYDLYIAFSGCRLVGTDYWKDLFADYVFRWTKNILGNSDAAKVLSSTDSCYEKLINIVSTCEKHLESNYDLLISLNKDKIAELRAGNQYALEQLIDSCVQYRYEDLQAFYEYSFDYKRDIALIDAQHNKAEEAENRILEEYDNLNIEANRLQAEKVLRDLDAMTEVLQLIFLFFELEYEKNLDVEIYLEQSDEFVRKLVDFLYERPYHIRKILKSNHPEILEKIEDFATQKEDVSRVLAFIIECIKESNTSKKLLQNRLSWEKQLKIKFVSEETIETLLDAILQRLIFVENQNNNYKNELNFVAKHLECEVEFEKETIKATLATGESLYKQFVLDDNLINDYSCIGIMYYRALEDIANKLLYKPYFDKILIKQRKKVYEHPTDYITDTRFMFSNNKIKETCELGVLGHFFKQVEDIPKYFDFIQSWTNNPNSTMIIKSIGDDFVKISNRRNDMAHGGSITGKNTAKVARNNVFVSTESDKNDILANINELIRKILNLF